MPCTSPPLRATPVRYRTLLRFPAICLAIVLTGVTGTSAAAEALLWFSNERPTADAQQAVDLLVNAAADGLDARDYHAGRLRDAFENARDGPPLTQEAAARLDHALTSAMRRYLTDLRFGRVEPRQLHASYGAASAGGFDPDALLHSAIADNRLTEAAHGLSPALSQYAGLRETLARYHQLAGNPAWKNGLPPLPGGKLTVGQKYAGIPTLVQRLVLLGDLPAAASPLPNYDGQLVEGIKSFQERHALTPDGVIGRDTLEQLNVPPETRARQIELALERLRWTPLLPARRTIVINIPEFMLRAYEVRDGRIEGQVAMKVIVGAASKSRTPLFDAEMRFVEFNPYWNVPPSIAKGETLPRLRRDPAYFDHQGFEFVGSDGRVVAAYSENSLDAVERGQMRLRQRPGRSNALGDIKFVFPNKDNIYLHYTPTPQLFKRDRRDFSHGCIRVEAPGQLAKFVLAEQPEWTEQRITQATKSGRSTTLRLPEGLSVVISYSTATVREGRVRFFPDIYAQDRLLDDTLRRRSIGLQTSHPLEIAAESHD